MNLTEQIERLGRLRGRRQELQQQEDALARSVRAQMSEHGMTRATSEHFDAQLITQNRLEVVPADLRRLVSAKEFLECVSVSVTAARRIVGDKKLSSIAETRQSVQLRLQPREHRPNIHDLPAGRTDEHHQ